ncbi:MAG: hypothetical protein D6679_05410 [Candidatus Hydrogenedentota bacterium]|nr:MAG: hypothetical protein D6679_05410 [Candidatus Hydrogenedentota bacterium]
MLFPLPLWYGYGVPDRRLLDIRGGFLVGQDLSVQPAGGYGVRQGEVQITIGEGDPPVAPILSSLFAFQSMIAASLAFPFALVLALNPALAFFPLPFAF